MEFNLIRRRNIEFKTHLASRKSKERKVESITRTRESRESYGSLTVSPVLDESGCTLDRDTASFREKANGLLFGDTRLARKLKRGSKINLTVHLTMTSSNTASLKIENKVEIAEEEVDIFNGLHKLQESLPPNTIQFILRFEDFDRRNQRTWLPRGGVRTSMDFKGMRLLQNRRGSLSIQTEDINFVEGVWWEKWRDGGVTFSGWLSLNVRLDMAAVIELYKKRFGNELLAREIGSSADIVILVGGNKDQETGIKCHKAILSGMSPVLAAMFQADMLEAKEGTWEIVDFSEAVIRAFVEFAYRRNVEEALRSSEMALELLKMADKYEIKELKDMLLQIIWSVPFTWFSVDMLTKLVFYAKNAGEDLAGAEKKGWAALKWYANSYPEKVMESKEYASLCENPGVMMELGLAVLKNIDSDRAINW